ncbi:MAG: glycoside hydrolase family 5 protein [Thermogutta sp.]|nr:glycoside hydrolase family 5 protein [Thermogutta sp.]
MLENFRRITFGIVLSAAILGLAHRSPPAALASETQSPIALHPDNPHYFLWQGKPTVLVTSGEHYGAVLNLDFDFAAYLETLAADGLNHTRTFSGTYREIPSSFGITDNPLAPQPNRYLAPWARSDQPGYFDGGNKFDLTRWDEAYFRRLHEFLAAAKQHGVVVEFNLFCPFYNDDLWKANPMNAANNVNGIGTCPREEVYTLKHDDLTNVQLAFVRKVVQELKDCDNLYYEVCNEPYFGGVTEEWQWKVADVIAETEHSLGVKHLVSMNIANGSKKVERLHPAVKILNFHYSFPPVAVAENYHWNVAIGENETGFRGKDDLLYRTEGWAFMLAGGALYNNLDYSFTPRHPRGDLTEYSSPGGGSPALRKQLGILKRFLDDMDFVHMRPDPALVQSVSPKLSTYALVEEGRTYAVYLHAPLPHKPKKLSDFRLLNARAVLELKVPSGTYSVVWTDTKTGERGPEERAVASSGTLRITSPEFDDDIAVVVRASRHP